MYISNKVDKIYLSKHGCINTSILHPNFPTTISPSVSSIHTKFPTVKPPPSQETDSVNVPKRPKNIPYPPIHDNIPKLKQNLLKQFNNTAFNPGDSFPEMNVPAAHIHVKSNEALYGKHTTIPVPYHFKESVKQSLDKDVEHGIITPVANGTPTQWCCPMVVKSKGNRQPRRTIDLQRLETQNQ